MIGIDESGTWNYCGTLTEKNKLVSILTLAENAGMSTGFVTTARATHASPSPLYAHSVSGDWESDKDKLEEAKDDATNCPDIGIVVVRKKKHFEWFLISVQALTFQVFLSALVR